MELPGRVVVSIDFQLQGGEHRIRITPHQCCNGIGQCGNPRQGVRNPIQQLPMCPLHVPLQGLRRFEHRQFCGLC